MMIMMMMVMMMTMTDHLAYLVALFCRSHAEVFVQFVLGSIR